MDVNVLGYIIGCFVGLSLIIDGLYIFCTQSTYKFKPIPFIIGCTCLCLSLSGLWNGY